MSSEDRAPVPAGRRARLRPHELVLYTRSRCGICRTAERQVVRELRLTAPWRRPTLRLVDVDADPDGEGLAERYGVRVPVVVLDGVELSELQLERGVVHRALRRRGGVR
jgi:glutaredoxin